MRAVVQTVSRARVMVGAEVVGAIGGGAGQPGGVGEGLLVLLGVTHTDDAAIAEALAGKVYRLRILDGERSAAERGAPVLVVSQFTLYGDTGKGRRPSWTAAAPAVVAEPLVTAFVAALRAAGAPVATGAFGARMQVESVNVGPRTLIVDLS